MICQKLETFTINSSEENPSEINMADCVEDSNDNSSTMDDNDNSTIRNENDNIDTHNQSKPKDEVQIPFIYSCIIICRYYW